MENEENGFFFHFVRSFSCVVQIEMLRTTNRKFLEFKKHILHTLHLNSEKIKSKVSSYMNIKKYKKNKTKIIKKSSHLR
jgi:hypothetical protein